MRLEDGGAVIHVVMVFDEGHAVHAATVLTSVAINLAKGHTVEAHLMCSEVSDTALAGLRRLEDDFPQLVLHTILADLSAFEGWNRAEHISLAAYLRLMLGEILPKAVSRAIYLDTDVICLDSLHRLASMDLGEAALGAVRDTTTPTVSSPRGIVRYETLGMDADDPYFNSGVMLIDVGRWKRIDPMMAGRAYVEEHGDVQQALDQEILNVCFNRNWVDVGLRWNVSPRLVNVNAWPDSLARTHFEPLASDALSDPAIIHFLGPKKPWRLRSAVAFRDTYLSYQRRSPFLRPRRMRIALAREEIGYELRRFMTARRRRLGQAADLVAKARTRERR